MTDEKIAKAQKKQGFLFLLSRLFPAIVGLVYYVLLGKYEFMKTPIVFAVLLLIIVVGSAALRKMALGPRE